MSHPIDRRKFLKNVSAASVLAYGSMSSMKGLAATPSGNEFKPSIDPNKLNVGIYLYPNVTMLDAYGPLQVLAVSDSCNVFTFAKHNKPVYSDAKTDLLPHYGFSDCPRVDILLVPGSGNPIEQINDTQVIQYLKVVGKGAKYITSVCTGSLILAETGLLDGYKTATHWAYQEVLSFYPQVTYVDKRVLVDRNRISGGGVTAGIDFALTLVAELSNRERAQHIELIFEYDPKPPFQTGNPHTAPRQLKKNVQANVRKLAPELFRDRSKG